MRIALLGPGKGSLYRQVVFRTGSTVHLPRKGELKMQRMLHLKVPVFKSGHAFQASITPNADFTQSRSSCVLIEILIEARSGVTILFLFRKENLSKQLLKATKSCINRFS